MRDWTLSHVRVRVLDTVSCETMHPDFHQVMKIKPFCCESDTILPNLYCKMNKNQLQPELCLEILGKVTENKACVQ